MTAITNWTQSYSTVNIALLVTAMAKFVFVDDGKNWISQDGGVIVGSYDAYRLFHVGYYKKEYHLKSGAVPRKKLETQYMRREKWGMLRGLIFCLMRKEYKEL